MPKFLKFFIPAVSFRALDFLVLNLDGQGVYMEWEVTRDNTPTPDEGEVRIYNLRKETVLAIHTLWVVRPAALGFPVTLGIGWQNVTQKLMVGDMWEVIPDERTPTDVISIFRFGDGLKNLRDATVGRTMNGVRIDQALNYLIQLPIAGTDAGGGGLGLGYPPDSRALVIAAANATPIPVLRAVTAGQNTREVVTDLMDMIGLQWRVHNGAFIAMRGGIITRPGPILTPVNGLIGYTKKNDGGINVEALANPDVEPGIQLIVLDNLNKPVGAPLYRVERVSFRGNTSGESLMNIDAAKATVL